MFSTLRTLEGTRPPPPGSLRGGGRSGHGNWRRGAARLPPVRQGRRRGSVFVVDAGGAGSVITQETVDGERVQPLPLLPPLHRQIYATALHLVLAGLLLDRRSSRVAATVRCLTRSARAVHAHQLPPSLQKAQAPVMDPLLMAQMIETQAGVGTLQATRHLVHRSSRIARLAAAVG